MMLVKKVAGVLCMMGAAGLLINSMVMTFYLYKIDRGLSENLQSIMALGQFQQSVIEKNEELNDMLFTVGEIDQGMNGTITRTAQLLALLSQVVDLNTQTLQLNRDMASVSRQSGATISQVKAHVKSLQPHTEQMKTYMEQLKQLSDSDVKKLDSIRRSTDQMNRKIPGGL